MEGKIWAILILLVIHKCNTGWESSLKNILIRSTISNSRNGYQCLKFKKVQTVTEILFLLFTPLPQAHQKNPSDVTKGIIYSSVLCTFLLTPLYHWKILTYDKDVYNTF